MSTSKVDENLQIAGIKFQSIPYTVGHADLTDTDTSQAITVAVPDPCWVMGSRRRCDPFSGGTVSALTLNIGTSGNPDAIDDDYDAFGGDPGDEGVGVPDSDTGLPLRVTGGTVQLLFTSTDGNLDTLDAGEVSGSLKVYSIEE